MVTLSDLQQADPAQWKSAADGWQRAAEESAGASNDLHAQGVGPLDSHWQDKVGQAAGQKLAEQADALEVASDIMRGVAMVLDGLTHSIEYAKSTLARALTLAQQYDLPIDLDQGRSVPAGNPDAPQNPDQVSEVDALLAEALREANQADQRVAAELVELGNDTCVTDLSQALDRIQGEASDVELASYQGDIPSGDDPRLVADWWNGLTPLQQHQFMLSEPVTIAGLPGIPDEVKAELHGTDGKYDRVALVKYAQDHWNDGSGDVSGEDNCTNFTSTALHEAGMQYKGWNTLDQSGWGESVAGETGWNDPFGLLGGASRTHSWSGAQNLHDFLVGNGGSEVPQDQVKPGDIVFFQEDNDQDPHLKQGNIHHTAIVTAVTPDGDVRYTQHDAPRRDVSLSGRSEMEQREEGQQKMVFVRPQPNWY
ncbi:amidase domain-containing protein [Kitasatospora sp. NPDC006697]|uniref:amidase domain-containing protein n=1 Tax=Kitasatospora sp. NPDC006697 TaxID=3364020 RepID=UPI003690983E